MNKKAQTHIVILFVVAVAAVCMMFYAIVSSNNDLQTKSESLASLVNNLEFNEEYIRAEAALVTQEAVINCPGCSTEALKEQIKSQAEKRNTQIKGTSNFFGKARTKDILIEENEENFTIRYNDLLVLSENDAGKLQRTFSVCLVLSKDGKQKASC